MREQIQQKIKAAMIAKDTTAVTVYRSINAALLSFEKEKAGNEVTEEISQKIIRKLAKQGKDSANIYQEAGRTEAAEKELAEVAILEELLPQNVDQAEIEAFLAPMVTAEGWTKKDFGTVMKTGMQQFAGRVDGNDVKAVAGKLLK